MRRTTALGKICDTVDLDFLRAEARVNQCIFSAGRTFLRHRSGVPTQMAAQPSRDRGMPMKGERDAAIRDNCALRRNRCTGAK